VSVTNDPRDPRLKQIDPNTGLQATYLVLSDEERAKGFVRPVRDRYKHVGARPRFEVRDLTIEETERYKDFGYVKFEGYPSAGTDGPLGRFWTQAQLHSGCGTITTMGLKLAETYARDPAFYGATYCAGCQAHYPVGEHGEFEWLDGSKVGS
jgi:hypothetical protein